MTNPIENWDQAKILALAKTTGKSLEVECALMFTASNASVRPAVAGGVAVPALAPEWVVDLGSYYRDDMMEKTRELDVLATRVKKMGPDGRRIDTIVQVMVSCKGFPPDCGPVAYSMRIDPEVGDPDLMIGAGLSVRAPDGFAAEAGRRLLTALELRPVAGALPAIIGYNVFKEAGADDDPTYDRARKEEKDLFEHGMDSAVKAAVYRHWLTTGRAIPLAFIPVMVTDKPWWQFPVDTGEVGAPELKKLGYLVNTYPITDGREEPIHLLSLICAKSEFARVVRGIETFADWFANEAGAHCGGTA